MLDVVQEKCKASFPKMKVFCLCFLHLRWCKGIPSASPHTAPGLSSGGCGHADFGTEENTMTLQMALEEYLTLSTTGLHRDSPIPAVPLFLKVLRTQCPLHQQLDLPTTYLQLQPAHSQMAQIQIPNRDLKILELGFQSRMLSLSISESTAQSLTPTSSVNHERTPYQTNSHLCKHVPMICS